MKCVLSVKKESCYYNLNGGFDWKTHKPEGTQLDILNINEEIVTVDIDGMPTNFSHLEVIILDFEKELQDAYDKKMISLLESLREYRRKQIIEKCQSWYDDANWCGYAITFLGDLSAYKIDELASEVSIKLTYSCPA